jgi:hypothetical protein
VSDPTFFLTKYDFKGPKIAFQNLIFNKYLNLVYKNGQNYEITPFFDGFCFCSHPFSDMDPDPEPSSYGSGSGKSSGSLRIRLRIHNTDIDNVKFSLVGIYFEYVLQHFQALKTQALQIFSEMAATNKLSEQEILDKLFTEETEVLPSTEGKQSGKGKETREGGGVVVFTPQKNY